MNVNVKGIWQMCKAAVPQMRKAGGGSIVNISSLAAVHGMAYAIDYGVSKAAVIGITRCLARELGRDWIRVNSVAPSLVLTEGTTSYFGAKHEQVTKASHTFNLLDARRAISVTERQRYILRVRALARAVAEAYFAQREKLGFPGLKKQKEAA